MSKHNQEEGDTASSEEKKSEEDDDDHKDKEPKSPDASSENSLPVVKEDPEEKKISPIGMTYIYSYIYTDGKLSVPKVL